MHSKTVGVMNNTGFVVKIKIVVWFFTSKVNRLFVEEKC